MSKSRREPGMRGGRGAVDHPPVGCFYPDMLVSRGFCPVSIGVPTGVGASRMSSYRGRNNREN
jgi:hypothetical protein